MQIPRETIERSLLQKGFVREGGDHRYFYHEIDGKRTGPYTYISHGSKYKSYGIELLKRMKKELKLDTIGQVYDLCSCPMSGEAYNDALQAKGIQLR